MKKKPGLGIGHYRKESYQMRPQAVLIDPPPGHTLYGVEMMGYL
jgi:hypothetical protein